VTPETLEERTKRFHDHLDLCEHCDKHPFDLCAVGRSLLLATALKVVRPIVNMETS
jgi:hypothetical protein